MGSSGWATGVHVSGVVRQHTHTHSHTRARPSKIAISCAPYRIQNACEPQNTPQILSRKPKYEKCMKKIDENPCNSKKSSEKEVLRFSRQGCAEVSQKDCYKVSCSGFEWRSVSQKWFLWGGEFQQAPNTFELASSKHIRICTALFE